MTLRTLLIAAAALICLCAADVSHINQKPPQDVLAPFNDLLPPPLEESSSTTTTTEQSTEKSTEATPVTKPTKKSYYQQQARSKDTHQVDEKPKLQLALELLPPYEEAPPSNEPEQQQIEEVRTTTHQPLVGSRATATTKKSVPHVAKPQPQQLQPRVARPNSIASDASTVPAKSGFAPDLITQYLNNFQFTTRQPSRGPLPTLTPFPRHIKK